MTWRQHASAIHYLQQYLRHHRRVISVISQFTYSYIHIDRSFSEREVWQRKIEQERQNYPISFHVYHFDRSILIDSILKRKDVKFNTN